MFHKKVVPASVDGVGPVDAFASPTETGASGCRKVPTVSVNVPDGSQPQNIVDKEQCRQCLHELVAEMSLFASRAVLLGGNADCWALRDELHRKWTRTFSLIQRSQISILPHLRGSTREQVDVVEYEKLWNEFSSSVELFLGYLNRTLRLIQRFPLRYAAFPADESPVPALINTGMTTETFSPSSTTPLSVDAIGLSHVQHGRTQSEGLPLTSSAAAPVDGSSFSQPPAAVRDNSALYRLLEADLINGRTILRDIHNKVDIKPWEIESSNVEQIKTRAPPAHRRVHVGGLSAVVVMLTAFVGAAKQRRCLTIILLATFIAVIAATVTGVVVKGRTSEG